MEYFAFLIAEAAAFAVGFFIGKKTRVKHEEIPLTEEEKRVIKQRQEQWDNLMSYTGRNK